MERRRLFCPHYRRWLHPVHPAKHGTVSGCHLCSTDADSYPRNAVEQMVCAFCACAQPCAASCYNQDCTAYGKKHAYYCNECHLWEHAPRSIFHCTDCGICRVGVAELYRHCDQCGMCVPRKQPHKCWMNGSSDRVGMCPICFDDMRTSRRKTLFLTCGHAAHVDCLTAWWTSQQQYSAELQCMVCRATVE